MVPETLSFINSRTSLFLSPATSILFDKLCPVSFSSDSNVFRLTESSSSPSLLSSPDVAMFVPIVSSAVSDLFY